MSKIDLNAMQEAQFDVLKEIGNIGAGNATSALAILLNMKVDMSVPKVELIPLSKISENIGNEEDAVVGILLQIDGEIDGMMMFLFDMKSAHYLVDTLMLRPIDDNITKEFSEMDMSALNEIGNIVSGSYLSALSGLTGLNILTSVPSLTVDMLGALLSVPAAEFGKYGDKMLMIESKFGKDENITGYFLLIPKLDSYEKILSSLGM